MPQFRKKPVVIEAFQMTEAAFANDGGAVGEWPIWAKAAAESSGPGSIHMHGPGGVACKIETLEGVMDCAFGDWIIRGVQGEIYPCKPDIFAATYEPLEYRADLKSLEFAAMAASPAVAWRYQRKVGWGDIWRVQTVRPLASGFEAPVDWRVQPLGPIGDPVDASDE